jgi:ribA/ribD-fused uncharacterized protein
MNSPKNIKELLEIERYNLGHVSIFCKSKDPLGTLQNMTGGMPITWLGIRCQSSEGAYQAQKFVDSPHIQKAIAEASSGYNAKLVAKKWNSCALPMERWERLRLRVMYEILAEKFRFHERRIIRQLLARKYFQLVELSHKDRFWGAVFSPSCNRAEGANVLGKLWHAVLDPVGHESLIEELKEIKL